MGSSIYVRDVNAVGVRVADGEVALEGEGDDHEDGGGHEDLSSRYVQHRRHASLTFITYWLLRSSSFVQYTKNGRVLTCATMSRYCPTTVITAERERDIETMMSRRFLSGTLPPAPLHFRPLAMTIFPAMIDCAPVRAALEQPTKATKDHFSRTKAQTKKLPTTASACSPVRASAGSPLL